MNQLVSLCAAALLASGCVLQASPSVADDLSTRFRTCSEGGPASPRGLQIQTIAVDDLAGMRVRDPSNGVVFEVLFDEASGPVARRCLPLLGALYGEIALMTAINPSTAAWHGVIFSETGAQSAGHGELWPIRVVDGGLDEEAQRMLASVLPHEQTHAAVRMASNAQDLPRWYREGVASWVEQSLLARMRPDLAQQRAQRLRAARDAATDLAPLKDWGPIRFSIPSGGGATQPRIINGQMIIQTGPRDAATVTTELANYAAALDVLQSMENEAGRPAVVAWIAAVAEAPSPPDTPELIRLARVHTGLDLTAPLN